MREPARGAALAKPGAAQPKPPAKNSDKPRVSWNVPAHYAPGRSQGLARHWGAGNRSIRKP